MGCGGSNQKVVEPQPKPAPVPKDPTPVPPPREPTPVKELTPIPPPKTPTPVPQLIQKPPEPFYSSDEESEVEQTERVKRIFTLTPTGPQPKVRLVD